MPAPASVAATRSGSPRFTTLSRSTQRRRGDVVDPEAEREAPGARTGRAVEHDGVLARERRESAGSQQRPLEAVEVRIVVDRETRIAGEAVLVEAGDDTWLDPTSLRLTR